MGTIDTINKIIDLIGAPFNPSEENVDVVIDYFIPVITKEALANNLKAFAYYLKTKDESLKPLFDPMYPLMKNYSNILNGKSEYIIRKIGRRWWRYILPLIQNPSVVAEKIIKKKPEIEQMLNGVIGKQYMQYFTKRLADFFEIWLWKFPRWHNGCGGLIRYGLVSPKGNLWGFYCRRCGVIIPDDQLEELTHTKKT